MRQKFLMMILLTSFCLATTAAMAQDYRPVVTVQIATTRNDLGEWTDWQTVNVTLDEKPTAALPPHSPVDYEDVQDWWLPHRGQWWHFSFTRSIRGTYALRWCYGGIGEGTIWSPITEVTIIVPDSAVHK